MRDEQITPRSIDRKAFGLTAEDVADFLRRNPEVVERTEGRIHTGIDVEGHLARAGFLMWDCPECGSRVASKHLPEALDVERLARALVRVNSGGSDDWWEFPATRKTALAIAREYAANEASEP